MNLLSLILDGMELPHSGLKHTLRLFLDSQVLLNEHVATGARRAFTQVHIMCQFCPFLELEALETVIYTLITLQLNYYNALYVGLFLKTT